MDTDLGLSCPARENGRARAARATAVVTAAGGRSEILEAGLEAGSRSDVRLGAAAAACLRPGSGGLCGAGRGRERGARSSSKGGWRELPSTLATMMDAVECKVMGPTTVDADGEPDEASPVTTSPNPSLPNHRRPTTSAERFLPRLATFILHPNRHAAHHLSPALRRNNVQDARTDREPPPSRVRAGCYLSP